MNTRYNNAYMVTKEIEKDALLEEFHTLDYETIIQKHQVGRRLNESSSISVTRVFAARVWVNRWMYKSIAPWFKEKNKIDWNLLFVVLKFMQKQGVCARLRSTWLFRWGQWGNMTPILELIIRTFMSSWRWSIFSCCHTQLSSILLWLVIFHGMLKEGNCFIQNNQITLEFVEIKFQCVKSPIHNFIFDIRFIVTHFSSTSNDTHTHTILRWPCKTNKKMFDYKNFYF